MFKDLLLNFLILILFLLYVSPFLIRRLLHVTPSTWLYKAGIGILHGGLSILLLQFTVLVPAGGYVNFRGLPILLAAFFGGPVSAITAAVTMTAARLWMFGSIPLYSIMLTLITAAAIGAAMTTVRGYWGKWLAAFAVQYASNLVLMVLVQSNNYKLMLTYLVYHGVAALLTAVLLQYLLKADSYRIQARRLEQEMITLLRLQPGFTFRFQKIGNRYVYEFIQGELLQELQLRPDMFIGKALDEVQAFTPDFAEWLALQYDRAWAGERVTYEVEFAGKELLVTLKPIVEDGEVLDVIGCCVDVTDFRKAERERKLVNEESRAKSEFLAKLSHELRTPLHGIMGLTKLLQQSRPTPLQRAYADRIESSSKSLLDQVDTIIDMAKYETRGAAVESVEFQLEEVFTKLEDTVRSRLADKRVEAIFLTDEHIPIYIKGDPYKLRQALAGLLTCGAAGMESGKIMIRASLEHMDLDRIIVQFHLEFAGSSSRARSAELLERGRQLVQAMGSELADTELSDFGLLLSFEVSFGHGDRSPALFTNSSDDPSLLVVIRVQEPELSEALYRMTLSFGYQAASPVHAADQEKLVKEATETDIIIVSDIRSLPDIRAAVWPPGTKYIVLVSVSEIDQTAHTEADTVLMKPVSRLSLHRCLTAIQNRVSEGRQSDRRQLHIAVAEDHEINRIVIQGMLDHLGHKTLLARNGQELLTLLEQEQVDLVLMDIHMPVMDGVEATKAIRQHPDRRLLPIIALTANVMGEDHEEYVKAGMNDVVTKPLEERQLTEMIERWSGLGWLYRIQGIDGRRLLNRMDGKLHLVQLLLASFKHEYAAFGRELHALVELGDTRQLQPKLHTLKGVAANLYAESLLNAVKQYEGIAIKAERERHEQAIERIDTELAAIIPYIP